MQKTLLVGTNSQRENPSRKLILRNKLETKSTKHTGLAHSPCLQPSRMLFSLLSVFLLQFLYHQSVSSPTSLQVHSKKITNTGKKKIKNQPFKFLLQSTLPTHKNMFGQRVGVTENQEFTRSNFSKKREEKKRKTGT